MKFKDIYASLLVALGLCLGVLTPSAQADEWDAASQVVVASTTATLQVLERVRGGDEEIAKQRIAAVLAPVVDYPAIAKGVMAKFYRRANERQKLAFEKVFRTSLENTYAKAVLTFNIKDYQLQPSLGDDGRKDREKVWVKVFDHSTAYDIHYTMSAKTGSWKVTNVVLDGVNIGLAFRNQFANDMRHYGNDFDAVIANWVSDPR